MSREEPVTKTFTITAIPRVMRRLERFLALLHFNSNWGHSALFAMPLDGDGPDRIRVEPVNQEFAPEVNLIGGVGSGAEVAGDSGYSFKRLERGVQTCWFTRGNCLYKQRNDEPPEMVKRSEMGNSGSNA